MIKISQSKRFALVLLVMLPVSAWAETVRFCYDVWPPRSYTQNGRAMGPSIDILREAARRAKLEVEFRELPWNRCLEMVRAGKSDAMVDVAPREGFLVGETSTATYADTFWVRADDPLQEMDFSSLSGNTIGSVHGYIYPDSLLQKLVDHKIGVETSLDSQTNLRKLASGRLKLIISDLVTTRSQVDELGLSVRPLLPPYSTNALYPMFHQNRVELHRAVEKALADMASQGTIDKIYRQHLGQSFSQAEE